MMMIILILICLFIKQMTLLFSWLIAGLPKYIFKHSFYIYLSAALIVNSVVVSRLLIFEAGSCIGTLMHHKDQVLDVGFDFTGQYLVSASLDGTGRVYNALTQQPISILEGHENEVSKVAK